MGTTASGVTAADAAKQRERIQRALAAPQKIEAAMQEVKEKLASGEQFALDEFLAPDRIDGSQAAATLKTWEDQKKILEDQIAALTKWRSMVEALQTKLKNEGSPAFVELLKEQLEKLTAELAKHDKQSAALLDLKKRYEYWLPEKDTAAAPSAGSKTKA